MNYIVTKPVKSKGIAALLVIFLGPFGMFYSTIIGAFTMIGAVPLLIVLISVYKLNLLLIVFVYFLTCFIWSVVAVDSYNNRIETESYYPVHQKTITNTRINYKPTNADNIIENLNEKKRLLFKDLDTITHLHGQKVLSDDVFNKQKDTLLKKLETLSYNEASISNSPTRIIPQEDYEYIQEEKTSYLFVWILFILLIGSLIYFFYTKGMIVFDNHKKDSEEIVFDINKNDREKKRGGNWKLDGQKAMADTSKSVQKEVQKPIKSESEFSYYLDTTGRIVKDTTLLTTYVHYKNNSYKEQDIDYTVYKYMESTNIELEENPRHYVTTVRYFTTRKHLKGNIREHWMKLEPDYIDSMGVSHWYKNYKSSKDTGTFEK